MISQERFEELVKLARKGQLETMEAIKLAVHESIADERNRNTEMLTLLQRFMVFANNEVFNYPPGSLCELQRLIEGAKENTNSGRMCSCVECVPDSPTGPTETTEQFKEPIKPIAFMTADKRMLVFSDRIVGDGHGMIPLYSARRGST